jgi:hypothetical protein
MTRICFIVEGLSEENFIKNILIPHLEQKQKIDYKCINLRGGIQIGKIKNVIKGSVHLYDYVTTMVDLARLDNAKFKNYSDIMRMKIPSGEKARILEEQLLAKFDARTQAKIILYIQPYEFEALCFADLDALIKSDAQLQKYKIQIERVRRQYSDCESINNRELPGKRLEKYGYSKNSSQFYRYANLVEIGNKCPHFNQWIVKLESTILSK